MRKHYNKYSFKIGSQPWQLVFSLTSYAVVVNLLPNFVKMNVFSFLVDFSTFISVRIALVEFAQ